MPHRLAGLAEANAHSRQVDVAQLAQTAREIGHSRRMCQVKLKPSRAGDFRPLSSMALQSADP